MMYESQPWCGRRKKEERVKAVRLDNIRSIIGVKRTDRRRNERTREHIGVHKKVVKVINANTMRWHGNKKKGCE